MWQLNQGNFQSPSFTASENIAKSFRGLLFDSHWYDATTTGSYFVQREGAITKNAI